MKKDEFRQLLSTVVPAAQEISDAASRLGFRKLISVVVSADGYMSISPHGSGWTFSQSTAADEPTLNYTEKYEETDHAGTD